MLCDHKWHGGEDWTRECCIICNHPILFWLMHTKHLDGTAPIHCRRLFFLVPLHCTICPKGLIPIAQNLHSFHALPFDSLHHVTIFHQQRRCWLAVRDCDYICPAV